MRLIIAGSREIDLDDVTVDWCVEQFKEAVRQKTGVMPRISEVVSGCARGADQAGEAWAERNAIPVKPFPLFDSDWKLYGKSAAPRRNRQMADYADAALIIWDGQSRGSKHMHETMQRLGKPSVRITQKPKEADAQCELNLN